MLDSRARKEERNQNDIVTTDHTDPRCTPVLICKHSLPFAFKYYGLRTHFKRIWVPKENLTKNADSIDHILWPLLLLEISTKKENKQTNKINFLEISKLLLNNSWVKEEIKIAIKTIYIKKNNNQNLTCWSLWKMLKSHAQWKIHSMKHISENREWK